MSESDFQQIFLVMHIQQAVIMEGSTIFLNARCTFLHPNQNVCTFFEHSRNFYFLNDLLSQAHICSKNHKNQEHGSPLTDTNPMCAGLAPIPVYVCDLYEPAITNSHLIGIFVISKIAPLTQYFISKMTELLSFRILFIKVDLKL